MSSPIPKPFLWRRLHSLMGLWITLFLIEHLLTNSQSAFIFGEDGGGFVKAVNKIKALPFLPAIEIFLIGFPFLIHMVWGVKYLLTGEANSYRGDGRKPSLPQYPRNHAYTWQRITSWLLIIGVLGHVVHMRFIEYPGTVERGGESYYTMQVTDDPNLIHLSERLDFTIEREGDQLIAVTKSFGVAELLLVRDTFKSPLMIFLYTVFVIGAVYHAFNGFWTFLITWGVSLTDVAQRMMRKFAVFLMLVVGSLGLIAIWGS